MKRIKVLLAVFAAVATMVMLSAPAMAQSQGFNISGSGSGSAGGISGSSFSGGSIGGNSVGGGAGGGSIDLDGSGGRGVTLVGGSGNVDFDDHDIVVGSHRFDRFDFDDVGDHIRFRDIAKPTTTVVDNTPLNTASCTWVQVPTAWLDLYEWIVNPVEVSPGWWWGCGWRIF
jgi:hypothetical protein